jgi:pyridoxine/pyridoxamine 5'-phosphate oxidase
MISALTVRTGADDPYRRKGMYMTRQEVERYIRDVKFGYLATVNVEGAPRVRPVAMKDVYDDGLYFFTFATTHKVGEIAANPQVEMVWSKLEEQSQVRISGALTPEEDPEIQARFKADNPMVDRLLPPGAPPHLFKLYRLAPERVYMARGMVPYSEVAW